MLTVQIILDSLQVEVKIHVQSTHRSLQNESQNHIQIRLQFQVYSDLIRIKLVGTQHLKAMTEVLAALGSASVFLY